MDDLSGVPGEGLDERHPHAVSAPLSAAVGAASGAPAPGGITGWILHVLEHVPSPAVYALVGFFVFAEAALMIGFVFPGETAVVIGGALAGLGRVNLGVLIAVVVVAAIVGDSVGFEVGKRAGPWLLERRPLRGRAAVQRTLVLLERYGGPAVFLGRFTAFARAVIPGMAGMSGMAYRTFLPWNALGGVVWGAGFAVLGYVVGLSFEKVLTAIGRWALVVVAVGVAVVVVIEVVRRRRERARLAEEFDVPDPPGPGLSDTDAAAPGTGPSAG